MYIGIKLKQAKSFLDKKYNLGHDNELSKIKYNHSIDCLNILKFYSYYTYLSYGPAVLLHDIGRFYEKQTKNKTFNHASYGYNLLKKEFTDSPYILLPIKYHEEDLNWRELLFNDDEFLECSWMDKIKIIKGCKLVRDVDIISNMKNLAEGEKSNIRFNYVNKKIIDKLYNNEISGKDDIYNRYDEISYILCGLNLLSYKRSFKYIKKYKLIEKLKQSQLNMINDNKELCEITEKMYDFIKTKFEL